MHVNIKLYKSRVYLCRPTIIRVTNNQTLDTRVIMASRPLLRRYRCAEIPVRGGDDVCQLWNHMHAGSSQFMGSAIIDS